MDPLVSRRPCPRTGGPGSRTLGRCSACRRHRVVRGLRRGAPCNGAARRLRWRPSPLPVLPSRTARGRGIMPRRSLWPSPLFLRRRRALLCAASVKPGGCRGPSAKRCTAYPVDFTCRGCAGCAGLRRLVQSIRQVQPMTVSTAMLVLTLILVDAALAPQTAETMARHAARCGVSSL